MADVIKQNTWRNQTQFHLSTLILLVALVAINCGVARVYEVPCDLLLVYLLVEFLLLLAILNASIAWRVTCIGFVLGVITEILAGFHLSTYVARWMVPLLGLVTLSFQQNYRLLSVGLLGTGIAGAMLCLCLYSLWRYLIRKMRGRAVCYDAHQD